VAALTAQLLAVKHDRHDARAELAALHEEILRLNTCAWLEMPSVLLSGGVAAAIEGVAAWAAHAALQGTGVSTSLAAAPAALALPLADAPAVADAAHAAHAAEAEEAADDTSLLSTLLVTVLGDEDVLSDPIWDVRASEGPAAAAAPRKPAKRGAKAAAAAAAAAAVQQQQEQQQQQAAAAAEPPVFRPLDAATMSALPPELAAAVLRAEAEDAAAALAAERNDFAAQMRRETEAARQARMAVSATKAAALADETDDHGTEY
jgi:hypothetical protein